MLHSYAFSNFRSFLDRVEVSFTLTEKDTVIGWDRLSVQNQQRLTTAMAVLGANASGKTSLIQPLAFIAHFIVHSFNDPPAGGIPLIPHFKGRDIPSTFEVVADAPEADTLWRYRLSATMEHVVEESLESKIRRGGWRRIFERIRREDGKYLVTQTGFGLDQTQAENARPNVSLISWAAQFGVAIAQQIASLSFVSNMNIVGRNPYTSIQNAMQNSVQIFAKQPEMLERLRSFMANLDLGLSDIEFRENSSSSEKEKKEKEWFAFGVHRDQHNVAHELPFSFESSGTKAAFVLLAGFFTVLQNGGLIAYDEIESDLHPQLLEPLLDLFSNPDTNPHNAQIIFTCHAIEVLRFLQKSQVMLVERDGLESHAWRLDSTKGVRSDDNRVAKYLAGTYGAIPRL